MFFVLITEKFNYWKKNFTTTSKHCVWVLRNRVAQTTLKLQRRGRSLQ